MKHLLWIASLAVMLSASTQLVAQVDVEHRRMLTLQTTFPLVDGEQQIGGFFYYWFNENNYPWDSTALRVIYGGVFGDAELSYFLPSQPETAIGVGAGGGAFLDSVIPYKDGERLSSQQFWGDNAHVRAFVNRELTKIPIGDLGELPINVRATYGVSGSFFRETDNTRQFTIPDDFLTQTVSVEFRAGGIEPGLTAVRGAEIYAAAEAGYRTGFDAFGPDSGLFPAQSMYQKLYGSIGGKIPIKNTILMLRAGGGYGNDLDELSAYMIGGQLVSADAWSLPLHGYYTRELFADDFGLVNIQYSIPVCDRYKMALHLYADYGVVHEIDVTTGREDDWNDYTGAGCGVSFRAFWGVHTLIQYGYGFDAVRNGETGGHEIGLAFEKKF
jgi:hypothetical protein